jgi:hypothetical protein
MVARTTAAAVAEKQPRTFEVNLLNRLSATTFAWIVRVEFTHAAFAAGTEQRLGVFNFQHMMPAQRLAATALTGCFTQGIAGTTRTAVTGIDHIGARGVSFICRRRGCRRLRAASSHSGLLNA